MFRGAENVSNAIFREKIKFTFMRSVTVFETIEQKRIHAQELLAMHALSNLTLLQATFATMLS
jgi:hypothetical protein